MADEEKTLRPAAVQAFMESGAPGGYVDAFVAGWDAAVHAAIEGMWNAPGFHSQANSMLDALGATLEEAETQHFGRTGNPPRET